MQKITLSECSKRKTDKTYLIVYAIINEVNLRINRSKKILKVIDILNF